MSLQPSHQEVGVVCTRSGPALPMFLYDIQPCHKGEWPELDNVLKFETRVMVGRA